MVSSRREAVTFRWIGADAVNIIDGADNGHARRDGGEKRDDDHRHGDAEITAESDRKRAKKRACLIALRCGDRA
ncbi:hypothetical protein D3C78_1403100 [compost metagenome]